MSSIFLGHTTTELDADLENLLSGVPAGRSLLASLKQYLANNAVVNIADVGARCDGSSDDSAAVNTAIAKAIADGRGVVEFPPGMTLLASKISAHQAISFRGVGRPAGGIGNQSNIFSTVLHDFVGAAFEFDGTAGGAGVSGGGVEHLRIVQAHTSGSGGVAIRVISSGVNFTPGWVKIRHCLIEETASGHWSGAIELDGFGYANGPFDCFIESVSSHTRGTGASDYAVRINGTGGLKMHDCAFYDTKGNIVLGDANTVGQIQLIGVDGNILSIDHCSGNVHVFGGTLTQITDTANTLGPNRFFPGYLVTPFSSNSAGGAMSVCFDYDSAPNDAFHNGGWVPSRPVVMPNGMNVSGAKAAGGSAALAMASVDSLDRIRYSRNGDAIVAFGQVGDTSAMRKGDIVIGTNGAADLPRIWIGLNAFLTFGAGTPEGNIAAGKGSVYSDTTNGTLYVKQTGTGNTGWVAK